MKKYRDSIIFFVGAVSIFILVQGAISFDYLNNFWGLILLQAGVMAIVSLGLNLIYGFNGQFSLGQWGFYAIGAYTAADITYRFTNDKSMVGLLVVALAVLLSGIAILLINKFLQKYRGVDPLSAFSLYLIGVVIAVLLALQIGRVTHPILSAMLAWIPENILLQVVFFLSVLLGGFVAAEISYLFGLPVLTLGSDYFGIATLGFTIIVKVLLDNSDTMLGFEEMKGARGMIGIPKATTWAWVFLFLILVVIITRNLLQSSHGRAVVSVREDEIAAKAMGINVAAYKNTAFVLGSFFAGLAGALYAHINGFLHPETFNFIKSFDPMIIIVFGGLGSVTGTVLASFLWALVLEGFLRLFLPSGFETWRFVVYPLLLLIMMLLKPKGLFGGYELPYLRSLLPAIPERLLRKNNHKAEAITTEEVS
ncbi:MAG TPA: branched-chain amino acid ABC transporter permease [Anaerolineaceae bacterium]